MKKLISLISTEGKSTEQIVKEAWVAWEKYKRVEEEQSKKSLEVKKL